MSDLTGKVAIITGAASGIGRAGAEAFAKAGALLVLVDRDGESLARVAQQVPDASERVRTFCADISRPDDCKAMVDLALSAFGHLDVLWNNAAVIGPGALVADYPLADWDRVIAVNLTGVFLGMQAALPVMLRQKSGSIINTSSVGAYISFPGDSAYCAAKAGILMLSRTAAVEYAKDGIRINCLLPGLVDTPLLDRLPHIKGRIHKVVPLGRPADPLEVARCAVFLASDDASYVTGEGLTVDGGYMSR